MKVVILGSSAIGMGAAALATTRGHAVSLHARRKEQVDALNVGLNATGALEASVRIDAFDDMEAAVEGTDVVVVCVPGFAHRSTLDKLVPLLDGQKAVIVSSEISFSGLYLRRKIAERGLDMPVIVWGTTVTTGRRIEPSKVWLNSIRANVDLSAIPVRYTDMGVALCSELFGEHFVPRKNALAIALSNVNPQCHLGIVLGSFTRMERGERWGQCENTTPAVGRLIEVLDEERLAVAEAFGLSVKTVRQHFHQSFHVPLTTVSEMSQVMHHEGRGGLGPACMDTRYIHEDVPYGLLASTALGRICGRPMVLHEAGIDIISAFYGIDFRKANDLIEPLNIRRLSAAQLQALLEQGDVATQ